MSNLHMVAVAVVGGVLAVLFIGYVVVPAARTAALENAPVAATWLAWTVDIFFPVGLVFSYLTRRHLSAPVFLRRTFPIWVLCVVGLILLYLNITWFVPWTTRSFDTALTNFIVSGGWLSPLLYWLIWPAIVIAGLLAVGLAAGFPFKGIAGSFTRRFR